jgi:hypothetical protein
MAVTATDSSLSSQKRWTIVGELIILQREGTIEEIGMALCAAMGQKRG